MTWGEWGDAPLYPTAPTNECPQCHHPTQQHRTGRCLTCIRCHNPDDREPHINTPCGCTHQENPDA